MRNILKLKTMKNLLLLLLVTFAISCCNKGDDDQPKTELEKLPPATQTGANTAGCLVNGVAFFQKGISRLVICFVSIKMEKILAYQLEKEH